VVPDLIDLEKDGVHNGGSNLARVDERLIHDKYDDIITKRGNKFSIFCCNDEVVANDKFMRELYRTLEAVQDKKQFVITPRKS